MRLRKGKSDTPHNTHAQACTEHTEQNLKLSSDRVHKLHEWPLIKDGAPNLQPTSASTGFLWQLWRTMNTIQAEELWLITQKSIRGNHDEAAPSIATAVAAANHRQFVITVQPLAKAAPDALVKRHTKTQTRHMPDKKHRRQLSSM
jgi:hypothetical protein